MKKVTSAAVSIRTRVNDIRESTCQVCRICTTVETLVGKLYGDANRRCGAI